MDQRRDAADVGGMGETSNMRSMTASNPTQYLVQDLRTKALSIRAAATEAEQDWLEVAESLEAAADELDRFREAVDHMVPDYTRPELSRILRDRERLRVVVENAPHACDCSWPWTDDEPNPDGWTCTCWKADVR